MADNDVGNIVIVVAEEGDVAHGLRKIDGRKDLSDTSSFFL